MLLHNLQFITGEVDIGLLFSKGHCLWETTTVSTYKVKFLTSIHATRSSCVWWEAVVQGRREINVKNRMKCQQRLFPEMGIRPERRKHHVSNAAWKGGIIGSGCTSLLTKDGA